MRGGGGVARFTGITGLTVNRINYYETPHHDLVSDFYGLTNIENVPNSNFNLQSAE